MANVEFGTGKTVVILSIVAACFAVLWPKIFYPMLTAISSKKMDSDNLNGCCDVIFDTDVNAIKIMTEMCGTILNRQEDFNPKLSQTIQQGKLPKEVINTCRQEVLNLCGIDIVELLSKREKLGQSYRHTLEEIRSFNISVCLRHNFGINPGLFGAPRRMRVWGPSTSRHLRQERPLHFRPEMMHPALREKGRAIPQSHIVPKVSVEKEPSARPIPMPGMRPPMGGAGHVVPPPKVGGTMSVVMPLYTIGIVIFFMYTVMKVFMKKTGGSDGFKDFHSDPEFRRVVFSEDYSNGCAGKMGDDGRGRGKQETPQIWKSPTDDSTRLVMSAITGLLAEVDQQLNREGDTQTQYSTELKDKKNLEEICAEEVKAVKKKELELSEQVDIISKEVSRDKNNKAELSGRVEGDETKPKVKVMGLELMAECEAGYKWSRPATPSLGVGSHSRPSTPIPPPYSPEPQNIFLQGSLPQQSQLIVTDSKTQALTLEPEPNEPEPPVILSSKMTLSLISLDAALAEENLRHEQAMSGAHNLADVKSDDDNLGTQDSTLLDVDSELIDETGHMEYESLASQGNGEEENRSKQMNEITEEPSTNYTTATMSERAEAGLVPELEDTAADVSNLDGLDLTEDHEDLRNEDVQLWNGNAREVEEFIEEEEPQRRQPRQTEVEVEEVEIEAEVEEVEEEEEEVEEE